MFTTWPQFKLGSWARWERDKRHSCGMFRPSSEEIYGFKKLSTLMSVPWIAEDEWNRSREHSVLGVFRGLQGYFRNISREEGWIGERLPAFAERRHSGHCVVIPKSIHSCACPPPLHNLTLARSGKMRLPLSWYE